VITRPRVTAVPVSSQVIAQVHAPAQFDGMPKSLKIKNRANRVLFDAAWSAGVEYEKALDDEDYEEEEEEEENNDANEEMDANEIADLLKENNEDYVNYKQQQEVDEAANEHEEDVDENAENQIKEAIELEESDPEYEDSGQEDEELVAEDKNPEETSRLRRSARTRVPNPRYQHL